MMRAEGKSDIKSYFCTRINLFNDLIIIIILLIIGKRISLPPTPPPPPLLSDIVSNLFIASLMF
uniref:Uncharacterized protein n=1 Tax=Lepeophtheirus salmonis TaxID=72036 RepID=A0A0K2VL27_LEPSM